MGKTRFQNYYWFYWSLLRTLTLSTWIGCKDQINMFFTIFLSDIQHCLNKCEINITLEDSLNLYFTLAYQDSNVHNS